MYVRFEDVLKIKGTVSLISSNPPCKDCTVTLKALFAQIWKMFMILNTDYFLIVSSQQKWLVHFYCRKTCSKYQIWTLLNWEKRQYLPHYWSDKGSKGTIVYQALPYLHSGSLEITLTVPLTYIQYPNSWNK